MRNWLLLFIILYFQTGNALNITNNTQLIEDSREIYVTWANPFEILAQIFQNLINLIWNQQDTTPSSKFINFLRSPSFESWV